jgi:DNA-binding Lrp family transcriptional regulator
MKEEKLLRVLKELIRNSKRSDREIAKAIGASQPTVTRTRKVLEKYIRSYTIIPEFGEIGYEIVAFTFSKAKVYDRKEAEAKLPAISNWYEKHHNVIFASDGEGLGKDGIMVSLHKNYSRYADFMRDYLANFADFVSDVQSFIVSLKSGSIMKYLDLRYLADDIESLD